NSTLISMNSTEIAVGSLSITSGKDMDQDFNSSTTRQVTNDMSPVSDGYTTSQPRVAPSLSAPIHNPPPIKAESLLARQRIQNAHDHTDSASESETEQGPRKRARKERPIDVQQQFQIGHHINAPRLPIYASLGAKDNLVVQIIRNQTPQDILDNWSSLGSGGPSISLHTTVLDKNIFPQSLDSLNFETMERGQKKNLVREYLEAKRENQEMNAEAWFLKSQEIHVGFSRQDSQIPIYSHLMRHKRGKLRPTFRVRSSDAVKSSVDFGNRLVAHKDIEYIEKYARATTEDSKKAIQEELEKIAQPTFQFHSFADLNKVPASSVQSEHALQLPRTMLGQEDRAIGSTGCGNKDYVLEIEFQNNHMNSLKARRNLVGHHAKKIADSFDEFVGLAVSQEKLALDARTEVEKLRKDNREQAQEIADLKTAMSQMQLQMAAQQTQPPASILRSIDIEDGLFEPIPNDVGSPGMLTTPEGAARLVELGGKKYEERTFLLECKLQYTGQPTGQNVQHEGMSFRRIMDEIVEKFVQNFEPSSLVQSEGRQFLKWVTLKEPPKPQKKTYHGI
ncbi:hypothetical protein N431DRAFT_324221, partial [Stipitochalara longipes BDJ]